MPWSSLCKSVTHKVTKLITGDEDLADQMGHYVGATVASATLDVTYPIIQTAKWAAVDVIKETASGMSSKEAAAVAGVAAVGVSLLVGEACHELNIDAEHLATQPLDEYETHIQI